MPLEFPSWELGKPLSYTAQFGLEEGMLANGAHTFVVPAFPPPPVSKACWQNRTPELAEGLALDQAWLGLVHARYEPDFCAWLRERVPIRVGMLFESMTYTPRECQELPALAGREAHVLRQVASLGLTHVLCADESDVPVINGTGLARAIWFPAAVPERFVRMDYRPPVMGQAAFFGNLYSEERKRLAAFPGIRALLAFPQGPEMETELPAGFDLAHSWMAGALQEECATLREIHAQYVMKIRNLRLGLFASWMGGLPQWNGLVNLPSYFKGYAGRVIEGMAAGVPTLSWRVPERPRNLNLFEDGKEILLFEGQRVEELMDHLARLDRDRAHGRRILTAARKKILGHHTSEIRLRQVLHWLDGGPEPDYGC